MTLDQYLKTTETSLASFGEEIGVTAVTVMRIRNGQQNLSRDLIRKIVEVTKGKVTSDELVFADKKAA